MSEPVVSNQEFETVSELAERLKVPVAWVYQRTGKNRIPHIKVGNHIRFVRKEIDRWLLKHHRDGGCKP